MSVNKTEAAAEIRAQVYRAGSMLYKTAKDRKAAELAAFKVSQAYRWGAYGIRFEARQIPHTSDWAVYAFTVPVFSRGEPWTEAAVEMIVDHVQRWGHALVREYNTAGAAKTTANRDNLDIEDRWPALAALGIRFKSQRVVAPHGKPSYAVYAHIPGRSVASENLQREAYGELERGQVR